MRLRIKDLRDDNDLKQADIAAALKIPTRTYGNYENELRAIPLDILIEIANFYGTSIDFLLGLTDEFKPYPRTTKNE